MSSGKTARDHKYGIGAVARLTGLTDHTIRAWERRYGAVVAKRSSNGRRVYDRRQVEKLKLLRSLTDQGVSIGQIANNDNAELREQAHALNVLVGEQVPEHVEVAAFGEFLPGQLNNAAGELAPLNVRVSDNNRNRFTADLQRHDIDVVILESPVLDINVLDQMRDTLAGADAAGGVLIYSFGRTPDINEARDARIVVLRAPVSVEEIRAAAVRALTLEANANQTPPALSEPARTDWNFDGPVAPRRFNTQQLATLVQASTSIDCECPHHLAQLVGDLNAFEIYSANCENRDEDDAELHRYLHQTTAQARALIEVALERVARAEGIKY